MRWILVVAALALANPFFPVAGKPAIESSVSTYGAGVPLDGVKYLLLAESSRDVEETWEYKEFSKHIEVALRQKGMARISDPNAADITVFLGYGIGEPKREVVTYSLPTFGQTGVSAASTTGSVFGNTVSATTIYTPSYGITGSTVQSGVVTTFDRWVRLTAINTVSLKPDTKPVEVWRVDVKSSGSSGDLRYIFPYMLFSAFPFIGSNTGRALDIKVKPNSKEFAKFIGSQIK